MGVSSLSGSYFNVMGLPVQRLYKEIKNIIKKIKRRMKMKSLMRLACLGAVAMTFVACEEDKHICTLPSFAGFRIDLRYGMREIRLRLRQYSKVWGIYCIRLNTIGVWNVRIRLH